MACRRDLWAMSPPRPKSIKSLAGDFFITRLHGASVHHFSSSLRTSDGRSVYLMDITSFGHKPFTVTSMDQPGSGLDISRTGHLGSSGRYERQTGLDMFAYRKSELNTKGICGCFPRAKP
ncbi:hypothetical protein PGT21_016839 [Puccinia graminis f. sp. tritici]|uniref:Uncharacterized protein n=1 Tax=Puccinia graminis f. sp. tritici TaxID=56615 RepID=A0A5B0QBK2_PUCGR|nr:hypothetical protein PGT21_016839 [Puccinia graminis f. sp. tritici]